MFWQRKRQTEPENTVRDYWNEGTLIEPDCPPDPSVEYIGLWDWVEYERGGRSFVGRVIAVDYDTQRAQVRTRDCFGIQKYWCGVEYLTLKAETLTSRNLISA